MLYILNLGILIEVIFNKNMKIMKQVTKLTRTVVLFMISLLSSAVAMAQDEGASLDINVNSNGGGAFYTQIWFWVVVGLVFILLLVALLRGGGSKQ